MPAPEIQITFERTKDLLFTFATSHRKSAKFLQLAVFEISSGAALWWIAQGPRGGQWAKPAGVVVGGTVTPVSELSPQNAVLKRIKRRARLRELFTRRISRVAYGSVPPGFAQLLPEE